MKIHIRQATDTDITGIRTLAEAVLSDEYDTDRAARFLERVYSTESLTRSLNSEGVSLLVAESGGQIMGFCKYGSPLIDDCEDRKEIHRLFVHPDHSMETVTGAFLEAIEADLRADVDVQRVSIYIQPDDDAAYDFYSDRGFHHEMVEDKDGEWYMEKTL